MEQKDYILKEIEKISVLLTGLIHKLQLKQKENETLSETEYVQTCEEIMEKSGFNLDSLFCFAPPGFDQYFGQHKGFNDENIEQLADLIFSMGECSAQPRKKIMLTKAMNLYNYLEKKQRTFSIKRAEMISRVESLLISQ